jgi:hypothetical protein
MELEFAFEARVTVGPALELGRTPLGARRRVIPILGGTVAGPLLAGEVLPGGADWQTVREDGVAEVEARYTLRLQDATLVAVLNRGYRHGPEAVIRRLAAGEAVDPALYYFRTAASFEVAAGPHDWLARHVFAGTGARYPDAVRIAFHIVR